MNYNNNYNQYQSNYYDYNNYNNYNNYNGNMPNKKVSIISRLVAFFIDQCIFILLCLLVSLIISLFVIYKGVEVLNIVPLTLMVLFILYNSIIYLLLENQSIGKSIMKLKIVSENGDIGFGKILLRSVFLYFCVRFTIFAIINLLFVFISPQKKTLYDIILKIKIINID